MNFGLLKNTLKNYQAKVLLKCQKVNLVVKSAGTNALKVLSQVWQKYAVGGKRADASLNSLLWSICHKTPSFFNHFLTSAIRFKTCTKTPKITLLKLAKSLTAIKPQPNDQTSSNFYEDTIPGPSNSIGAPKMYILEKRDFGTQISMLGF